MEHDAKARRAERERKHKNQLARARRAAKKSEADAHRAALAETQPCPFCDKPMPTVYGLPGVALLRADNETLICAECGTLEALNVGGLKMPVSKFLERYGSHDIYAAAPTARRFLAWTGQRAPWTPRSANMIRGAIAARGLGGHYSSDEPGIAGHEMAEACAAEFARFHSVKNGRGRIMAECIEALRGNGY